MLFPFGSHDGPCFFGAAILFLLLVAAPPERIEKERERDKPAHELREGVVGGVVRVARLLDGPEGSDSAEHPERDELRF